MRSNRGVLSKIAEEAKVSRTMVSLVVNRHRSSVDGKLEDLLRKYKVPGWNGPQRIK